MTKAARYGIKVYVIADAQTAYVLRVVFYTGKSTYNSHETEDKLKTIQIVNKLVELFTGSHRTIYVDWFYKSLDLLISLAEKSVSDWDDAGKPYPTRDSNRKRNREL